MFVAGTGKKFNVTDLAGQVIIHARLGVGMDVVDLDRRTKIPSLVKKVIQKEAKLDNLGEELRVLYVALTRAKEKLIITGTCDNLETKMAKTLTFAQRSSAIQYLDWIIPALAYIPEEIPVTFEEVLLEEIVRDEVETEVSGKIQEEILRRWDTSAEYDANVRQVLEEQFAYQYPYPKSHARKMKFTVSELKKMAYQAELDDEENALGEVVFEEPEVVPLLPKFMTEEEMNNLIAAMNGEAGDLLLFAADKNKVVWDVLGNLRLELAKQMELLDKNQYNFLWVTEFPLLEWSDEQNRYLAMHHPFTMPMEEDLQYIDSEPGRVRAKAYDIVLNGNEIGGGSVRIFQNDVQEKMFEVLGFTKEQAYEQFGFLLDAFKYGVPPHAGLAYGLDRMVMLMAKEDSIRDVMAFPKIKDASCLMTQAPSMADNKQLEELGLKLDAKDVKTEE